MDLGDALVRQIERECAGNRPALLRRLIDLIISAIGGGLAVPPPLVPAKIVKRKAPVPGQGNLFDD